MGYTRNGSVLNNADANEYKAAILRSKREAELQSKLKEIDELKKRIEILEQKFKEIDIRK